MAAVEQIEELNVRNEVWYWRYYQTVASGINNAHRKHPGATIYLLGIEGDVQYGKRTLQEWTFLLEDIDKHILDGKISTRPSNMRISLESFPQMVAMFASQPNTYVLVASCPARIGDNHNVMEDVREITSGKPWSAKVDLVFSSADSAASADGCRLFYVDPDTMEVKGAIPWSPQLHAELLPRGQFRVHTPGRTYYLEEVVGDVECAELWVKTITKLQARLAARGPRASNGGGGAASPGGTRGAPQMACRMSSSEARDA